MGSSKAFRVLLDRRNDIQRPEAAGSLSNSENCGQQRVSIVARLQSGGTLLWQTFIAAGSMVSLVIARTSVSSGSL